MRESTARPCHPVGGVYYVDAQEVYYVLARKGVCGRTTMSVCIWLWFSSLRGWIQLDAACGLHAPLWFDNW
jgi:hypothetical protein